MKMIEGCFFFASSNIARTREAPTPTNTSMNSDAEIAMNGTPASPASARASSVLPVPGGPLSSTPCGTSAPSAWNRSGSRRNSTSSATSRLALSWPAMSLKVTVGRVALGSFALVRPLRKLWMFCPPTPPGMLPDMRRQNHQ